MVPFFFLILLPPPLELRLQACATVPTHAGMGVESRVLPVLGEHFTNPGTSPALKT